MPGRSELTLVKVKSVEMIRVKVEIPFKFPSKDVRQAVVWTIKSLEEGAGWRWQVGITSLEMVEQ